MPEPDKIPHKPVSLNATRVRNMILGRGLHTLDSLDGETWDIDIGDGKKMPVSAGWSASGRLVAGQPRQMELFANDIRSAFSRCGGKETGEDCNFSIRLIPAEDGDLIVYVFVKNDLLQASKQMFYEQREL